MIYGLVALLTNQPAHTANADVWNVLRSEFAINHELFQPQVQEQIRWLSAHPSYINKVARQSEPYIYHILTEVRKRHLPGELALIPMIESAYDPFAYSGAGAAGLWQLMPGTGHDLGLKQDWWFDARRSIRPSTDAALNYLSYLHRFFKGNWLMAIAAYDSGEGTIAKAIKATGRPPNSVQFWSLSVPQETRLYVPRLLALAEIIKNPQRYHVNLPTIPYLPYFEEVDIGSQIDLDHAAKMAGISYKELIKLNPGYNRASTAPNQPHRLLIPKEKVARFNRNLANMPEEKRVSFDKHVVQSGDSLGRIANRYHTTVTLLKQLNALNSDRVNPGQTILLPSKSTVKPKAEVILANQGPRPLKEGITRKVIHIVQKNDTYPTLEQKYQVTAGEIRYWNKLAFGQALKPGSQLTIYKRNRIPELIVVKAGDTLSQIAKNHHTQMAEIIRQNPGIDKAPIHPGQKIVV